MILKFGAKVQKKFHISKYFSIFCNFFAKSVIAPFFLFVKKEKIVQIGSLIPKLYKKSKNSCVFQKKVVPLQRIYMEVIL